LVPSEIIEVKKAAFGIDKRPVLIYFTCVKRFRVQGSRLKRTKRCILSEFRIHKRPNLLHPMGEKSQSGSRVET
ncbi:MAG: hypothetical protein V2J65_10945, partial [Desulfobacteraceae bacterium]|jgi:hypothetical protein|nr:hypothetical protein [Desulfobacteraceae bacterium]